VDLILLDYEMPITDGPQVLEMLRQDDETAKIPVFFLTGRDDKESVVKVLDLKPEGYILKTVTRDELMNKLKVFFISRES
ncbi:MAG: response regulator, partial [Pseudobutyrivibrio sp.]|nr:response regulator [Pseudobutyrivibrio sp.]